LLDIANINCLIC